MRLFVAVKIPEEIREKAAAVAGELPAEAVSRVSAGNMHYTLQFLGDVDAPDANAKIKEIKDALDAVEFQPFDVAVKGIGFFPNENFARVVWLGTEEENEKPLKELADKIKDALGPLGFKPDYPFSAHLTIARVKQKIGAEKLREMMKRYKDTEFGRFNVSSFYLVKSALSPKGAVYEYLKEFRAR